MKLPDDFEVTQMWITPQENLLIVYRYTQDGKSIGRMVTPEFIDLPKRPPTDLGSIWE